MQSHEALAPTRQRARLATLTLDDYPTPEDLARCGSTKGDDQFRSNRGQLLVQPPSALLLLIAGRL
jgi:hypothetical protein